MTAFFSRVRIGLLALAVAASLAACSKNEADEVAPAGADDVNAGGAATVFSAGSNAYSLPAPNLRGASGAQHLAGDAAFERRFVTADGLGPLFINGNCTACHVRDGRGAAPLTATDPVQMLFRLSLPGQDAHGGPRPVPGFGDQLQNRAVVGTAPEGQLSIQYVEQLRTLMDGLRVSLRLPTYAIDAPYLPVPAGVLLSARVAPPGVRAGIAGGRERGRCCGPGR